MLTSDEKLQIARARGVSVKTVERWARVGGEDAARTRRPVSRSEAGRMGGKKSRWGESLWK
jgi:hypothetical protein